MTRVSSASLLDEELALLVQHFGAARVRAALRRIANESDEEPRRAPRRSAPRDRASIRPNIVNGLELVRQSDPEKHRLLSQFLSQLKERKILPESQDIRHFAQLIGLKNIAGKSRKDMIPTLMLFLLEQPKHRLTIDLQSASNISEQQRQRGFSVLTDKLLGEKDARY